MICIVGIECQGKAWIGADRCHVFTNGYVDIKSSGKKIVKLGDMYIGIAGDMTAINTLKYKASEFDPKYSLKDCANGVDEYMFTVFQNNIINALGDMYDGNDFQAIVSVMGKIYLVLSDFRVTKIPDNKVFAIGSGGNIALGSLYSLAINMKINPCLSDDFIKQAIEASFQAAAFFDMGVSNNFDICLTTEE
jgi:ATP-dependent protease HslVU (ClpYQ) peptidase subunit